MAVMDEAPWFRKRRYLHFDRPVDYPKARDTVTDTESVEKHAFYPLISYEITSSKLRRDPALGKLVRTPKVRPIAYAAHLDSHIYAYYADLLSDQYEHFLGQHDLAESIFAFRSLGLSNIDIAKIAFEEIRSRKSCAAIALDISGFFDNLNHRHLKRAWSNLLQLNNLPADHYAVYSAITRFSRVERSRLYDEFGISQHNPRNGRYRICTAEEFRTRVRGKGLIENNPHGYGIPQGTPISAVLSNIYMTSFDLGVRELLDRFGGRYMRYCDDILLIVPVSRCRSVIQEVEELINRSMLSINKDKTGIHTFRSRGLGVAKADKPLQYLGFTFDGDTVLIRSAALARYSQRMKKGVRLAKSTMRKWNKIRSVQGGPKRLLYKRSLYKKYSHFGRQNFLRYGYRAADILESPAIRDQLKPLWHRLQDELSK